MQDENNDQKISHCFTARDHLANERTFLAWVRTSIGIMAFGFVIEKFALFLKQISLMASADLQLSTLKTSSLQGPYSTLGAFLVVFGIVISLLAFFQFIKVRKQIEENAYQSSIWLIIIVTLFILFIGIFLAIYLNNNKM